MSEQPTNKASQSLSDSQHSPSFADIYQSSIDNREQFWAEQAPT